MSTVSSRRRSHAQEHLNTFYTPHGIRTVCHVFGTHDKTTVYGVPGLDGEQLFLQYDRFNGDTFAEYIKEVKREFGRALMIVDCAPQHRAGIVGETLRGMTGIRLAFLPAASPELSAIRVLEAVQERPAEGVLCYPGQAAPDHRRVLCGQDVRPGHPQVFDAFPLRRCGAAQARPYRGGCARYSSGRGDVGRPVRYHGKTAPALGPHGAATPRRSLLSLIFRVARFI